MLGRRTDDESTRLQSKEDTQSQSSRCDHGSELFVSSSSLYDPIPRRSHSAKIIFRIISSSD
jgi:hypothetical protein